jgi:NAD(P)-dependent dehydrogenase (short-subunit alcohol dehydrogenase family)
MRRKVVLLTDCLSEPGPDIARRLADAGATVMLNSTRGGSEVGDLLQEIVEHGGRAIGCSLDPSTGDGFDGVFEFVGSMSGPLAGVVLQSGMRSTPRPLEDTSSQEVLDAVTAVVEGVVDWCRFMLPRLCENRDSALVGLWSGPSSGSIPAAAAFAAWEQVLACTRTEATTEGVRVHVVQTPWASCGSVEQQHGLMGTQSATDAVIHRLGMHSERHEEERLPAPADGGTK